MLHKGWSQILRKKYGDSIRVIFGELGRPEAEVQRLMAAGVVSESRSRKYLLS
jgi:hypothetical protein